MGRYDDLKNEIAPEGGGLSGKPKPKYTPPPRYGPEWDALVARNEERKAQEAARRGEVKSGKGFEISEQFADVVRGKPGPRQSEEWRRVHGISDDPEPESDGKDEDDKLDENLDGDPDDEFDDELENELD